MDYQEAIGYFERRLKLKEKEIPSENPYIKQADDKLADIYRTAISAMQELQEYKQLGTLEEVREAMEKQKKKKPKGDLHSVPHYRCQNCNGTVKLYQNSKKDEICKWCGQHIDWSDKE